MFMNTMLNKIYGEFYSLKISESPSLELLDIRVLSTKIISSYKGVNLLSIHRQNKESVKANYIHLIYLPMNGRYLDLKEFALIKGGIIWHGI